MASAQTGLGGSTGTTSTALSASDLLIVVQSTPGVALPDFDLQRFFNVANCNCSTPVSVFFTLTQSGFAKKPTLPQGTVEFWVGLNCNNVTVRNCTKLGDTLALTTFAANGGIVVTTTADKLSQNFGQPSVTGTTTVGDGGVLIGGDGGAAPTGCNGGVAFSQTLWALVTFSGDMPYDVSATLSINVDLAPPPPPDPKTINVGPGNEGLNVTWMGIDTSVTPDLQGYQVLCDRAGSLQVFPTGTFGAGFRTCPTTPIPDGVSGHLLGLDPLYTCSKMLTQTADSWRIKVLQNDIYYSVAVVSVDNSYNASAPTKIFYERPQKTLSFYDVYRNGDETNTMPNGPPPLPGAASGGLCAVSGGRSRTAGAAGLATIALVTGLAFGVRRRRRPRP